MARQGNTNRDGKLTHRRVAGDKQGRKPRKSGCCQRDVGREGMEGDFGGGAVVDQLQHPWRAWPSGVVPNRVTPLFAADSCSECGKDSAEVNDKAHMD